MQRTFFVNAPVEQVVAYVADAEHAPEWGPGSQACRRVDDGPVEAGARWKNHTQLRGKQHVLDTTMKRFEPGRVTMVGRGEAITVTDDITVTDQNGGSCVTYDSRVRLHGMGKLATPLVKADLEKMGDEIELKLKKAAKAAA